MLRRLTVPDNLKSAVNKASFYDPEINRSYGMMTQAAEDVSLSKAHPGFDLGLVARFVSCYDYDLGR
jgi:hypothetical protein